eukprot:7165209-Alexandrium_andersonii.AAC.1
MQRAKSGRAPLPAASIAAPIALYKRFDVLRRLASSISRRRWGLGQTVQRSAHRRASAAGPARPPRP